MYSRYKRIIPRIYRQATTISIGNITKTCADPINPNLVPSGYLPKTIEQTTLRHLKWLLQKDLLSQDVFLIGHPGPTRRRLVFQYLEMTNREYEYLAISRDTTDSDVKQRRELVDGTSVYSDSPAVKAAINGRVLILDGIERAERNVLPILNNLLENREMQLDDGRFLVSSRRYDKLRERYSVDELTKDKLIRVSEDFRVIALGLPTPSYTGNLLDPPLRSRFQARQVVHELPKNKELSNIEQSLRILTTSEVTDFGIKVATESISGAVELENSLKFDSIKDLLKTVYPYNHLHKSKVQEHVDSFIHDKKLATRIDDISIDSNFVLTENNEKLLSKMLASHNSGFDICLIGGKGSGKTKVVDQFAINADLEVQPVLLYKDISWRELLQQRYTDSVTGDTKWAPSPLVRAALKGQLCVLDGVDHLHAGVL